MLYSNQAESDSGFLWVENGAGSIESFWIGIQRFMFLNDIDRDGLIFLKRRRKPFPYLAAHMYSRDGFDSLRVVHTPLPFLDRLDACYSMGKGGPRRSYLEPTHNVRYCPDCLAYCFHSLMFQFPGMTRCPYHGSQLVETCQKCGGKLAELGELPRERDSWFRCISCGHPYLPLKFLAKRVLNGLPEARLSLSNAYDTVLKMSMVEVTSASGMDGHDVSDDSFVRFHCHALHAAATEGQPKPSWLIGLDENLCCQEKISVDGSSLRMPRELLEEQHTFTEHLRDLLAILKSIDRQLAKRVRAVCKHRHSVHLRSARSSSIYFLQLEALDCPCCAVLEWWRAHFGCYFALYRVLQSHDVQSLWLKNKGWLTYGLPIQSVQVANSAWNTFNALSVQMRYRLGRTSTTLRNLRFSLTAYSNPVVADWTRRAGLFDEKRAKGCRLSVVSTPNEVGNAFICANGAGAPYVISYSVANSLRALADVLAIRQSGPLYVWPIISTKKDERKRMNDWYDKLDHDFVRRPRYELKVDELFSPEQLRRNYSTNSGSIYNRIDAT